MKKSFLTKVNTFLLLLLLLSVYTVATAQENRILNNDRLRSGSGSENSINTAGNMQQPFYYNGSTWRKLTYSNYPLDIRWGIGGDGTNGWNTNGTIVENPALSNQTFDYSGFTVTNAATGDGYGQIKTTGEITVNGQLFRVENVYELLQPEGYIAIKVKITNISGTAASNVRLWVGTRDDYVGGSDGPTKERGNLVNEEFVLIDNQADQAKAIKISTSQEAILFFSNSDRAFSTINRCCSFSNATQQNPATNDISETGDGSYALYVRFNDLAANQSDELIWYYGAGTLPEIDEIIERVASAAIGAFDNITYNSADYAATTVQNGTGYWMLVPEGATAPTAAQIEAGSNYNGVTIVGSGSAAMLADQEQIFNLTGLDASTTYDFHFVSKYFDGVEDAYTEIIGETLNTLEAPPIITDFSPKTAAFGETITIIGSNFLTTSDVLVGGLNATFTVVDSGSLDVVVPNGAADFYITVTNESGTAFIESEETGNTDASCSTGWSSAWQRLTIQDASILKTVVLELGNRNPANSYDLFLELHETDMDPLSANPFNKFNSLLEVSQTVTVGPNSNLGEVTFVFDQNTPLDANTDYYVVLKEANSNPSGTGEQTISKECSSSGTTDGGAGNLFGTLYHRFTVSPILEINNPPTDILISQVNIEENNTIGQVIGQLSATDADAVDTHIFVLIAGDGDDDNASFTVAGLDLQAAERFDFETKSSYTLRVRTTDMDGSSFEKAFSITIDNEVDEDFDSDGIPDSTDNCREVANADQLNTDGDAFGNACDDDDDNDGTPDSEDAFPLDENEDTDTDGDGTGDNADTDDDGDGTPDSEDAFPLDENEDTDTDGDGTGDNADTDDDGDGTPDSEDDLPKNPDENSDVDGDGIGDIEDPDDDNDGNIDSDNDGDGLGDVVDPDDDNDGIEDTVDDFPKDPDEYVDTDNDGIGDNADEDDDNDGYSDVVENEAGTDSKDASSNPKDSDNDGIPDFMDEDDDNDGVLDAADSFPEDNEPQLIPAEAFTPNGDGVNDTWVVPGIDNYSNTKVMVYNRWGHEVFTATNYRNNWNGNHQSGSDKLPPGSYLYVIDLGNGSAPLQGWVFINY